MKRISRKTEVAPHVGAWIETENRQADIDAAKSHPMWVRGLKLIVRYLSILALESHPMWVRGLKHELAIACRLSLNVAPHVGAWIETLPEMPFVINTQSHPMWVRGLKPH